MPSICFVMMLQCPALWIALIWRRKRNHRREFRQRLHPKLADEASLELRVFVIIGHAAMPDIPDMTIPYRWVMGTIPSIGASRPVRTGRVKRLTNLWQQPLVDFTGRKGRGRKISCKRGVIHTDGISYLIILVISTPQCKTGMMAQASHCCLGFSAHA